MSQSNKNKSSTSKKKGGSKATKKSPGKSSEKTLEEAKQSLEALTNILNKTSQNLPSLVANRLTNMNNMNGLLHDKFQTDIELISMLEDFFVKLVLLLRYRSSYDEKLSKISRQVKKLKSTETLTEFQGNLQLLGIILQETEQIVKNYEEMYNILFTEQALLQFQLMEQLAMFKGRDAPDFSEMFETAIQTFLKLNNKVSKYKR